MDEKIKLMKEDGYVARQGSLREHISKDARKPIYA